MKCQKCKIDLPEKYIQLSHDVPKYMGGRDGDGRHYLCKKCHDIYERIAFSIACDVIPEQLKQKARNHVKSFATVYFGGKDE